MSSAPPIGTGSPICSKGAWTSRNRHPTRRTDARDCGIGERACPHPTPIGAHFNLPAARLGNFRLPVVTVSIPPRLWTLPMARWSAGGELPGGFPGPAGEGWRCQPPGSSRILLDSKFLSNTFWGFPQPPPQTLAGRSGSPFSSPGKGWNRIGSWGFSEPYVRVGEWAPSGHGTFLGPGNGGHPLYPRPALLQSHPQPRPCNLPSLPFCNGDWGKRSHCHQGLRGGLSWGGQGLGTGLGPWGLSSALAES